MDENSKNWVEVMVEQMRHNKMFLEWENKIMSVTTQNNDFDWFDCNLEALLKEALV